jgi:hypothetical protein
MKLTALAIAAFVCGPGCPDPHGSIPPDKPFVGDLVETEAQSLEEMADFCSPHPRAGRLLGCNFRYVHSLTGKVRCYVFIAPKFYREQWSVSIGQIRRHELAHCNG